MPVSKGKSCVGDEMRAFHKGEMHSGKGGKTTVKDPQQAKAIALSVCGKSKYTESLMSMGYSEEVATQVAEMLYAEGLKPATKAQKVLQ